MEALLAKYKKESAKRKEKPSDAEKVEGKVEPTKKARVEPRKKEFTADSGPPHFLILGAQKAGTMAAVKNPVSYTHLTLPTILLV